MSPSAKRRTYRLLAAIGLAGLILLPLALLSGCAAPLTPDLRHPVRHTRWTEDGWQGDEELARYLARHAHDEDGKVRAAARYPDRPLSPPGAPFPLAIPSTSP